MFQVSKLVILHEEAEDGIPMPDLQQPVRSVSNAVSNLVKVIKNFRKIVVCFRTMIQFAHVSFRDES